MIFRRFRPRRKIVIISLFILFCFVMIYWSIVQLANYILLKSKLSFQKNTRPIRPRYGMNVIVGHYIGTGSLFNNYSRDLLNENNFWPIPGAGYDGNPVVIPAKDMLVMQQKYQINRYNLMASDRIPLNRTLPDVRRKKCIIKKYDENLPSTSVVIVFHNEAWSVLLRTVWSVINRSPSRLLEEIILVDDASDRDFLGSKLDEYVSQLPIRTFVLRQKTREGLVAARLLGAAIAKGETLTFLDAHCECTAGWLEPLLARVTENRKKVVCPVIDIISDDNFGYIKSFEMHWGAFNWQLHFRWYLLGSNEIEKRSNNIQPFRTPAMAGGLFSIDRNYFYEIGAYDDQMKIWGGDNLEISFRIWQCGGEIEIVPCSHVGHLFRKSSPYTFPGGVNKVLNENLARTALVWMDDWSEFFFKINNIPKDLYSNLDVSERKNIRQHLKCNNFDWYLTNVWSNNFFPNKKRFYGKILIIDTSSEEYDSFLNLLLDFDLDMNGEWPYTIEYLNKKTEEIQKVVRKSRMFCINKLDNHSGSFKKVAVQKCGNETTVDEIFIINPDGQLTMNEGICLDSFDEDNVNQTNPEPRIATCDETARQQWTYDIKTQELIQKSSDLCLTSSPKLKTVLHNDISLSRNIDVQLMPCSSGKFQKWILLPMRWY